MKRSWFGLFLLLLLLAIALTVTWAMTELHRPVALQLRQAAERALDEDWESAQVLSASAGAQWERWAHVRLCFADHTPIEDIDSIFAQLSAYAAGREETDFAAACRELAQKVEAVGQAHSLSLWNLF